MPSQQELEYIQIEEARHAKPGVDMTAARKRFDALRKQADELRAKLPGVYLYIQEDGVILKSNTEPTVADFLAVAEGLLQIIRIKAGEVVMLESDGVVEIPPAIVYNDDPHVGLYHAGVRLHLPDVGGEARSGSSPT